MPREKKRHNDRKKDINIVDEYQKNIKDLHRERDRRGHGHKGCNCRDHNRQSSHKEKDTSRSKVGQAMYEMSPSVGNAPFHMGNASLHMDANNAPLHMDVGNAPYEKNYQEVQSVPVFSMAPYFGFGEADKIVPQDVIPLPQPVTPIPATVKPSTIPQPEIPQPAIETQASPVINTPVNIVTDMPANFPIGDYDGWELRKGPVIPRPPTSEWIKINTRGNQCPDPTDFIYDPMSCRWVNKYHVYPNRYAYGPSWC